MDAAVISKIQNRLERDDDALKCVLRSFGVTTNQTTVRDPFHRIFEVFQDTPVTILRDVFEALQLHDLLELLEKSLKPHRSLQLAFTLDEIKKLNGVADFPTTYHSCGAVLIITDDENVSDASGIKTFFTDLDNKSDVSHEVIQRRSIRSNRNAIKNLEDLKEKMDVTVRPISRFANLLVGDTQKPPAEERQRAIFREMIAVVKSFQKRTHWSHEQGQDMELRNLESDIDSMKLELINRLKNPPKGETELRQTEFLQSMMVTVKGIQEILTLLIQRKREWLNKEEKKEEQNFREKVSAVTKRWIHRQG